MALSFTISSSLAKTSCFKRDRVLSSSAFFVAVDSDLLALLLRRSTEAAEAPGELAELGAALRRRSFPSGKLESIGEDRNLPADPGSFAVRAGCFALAFVGEGAGRPLLS